ncbi:MAG: hypothetical protein JWO20_2695 [Candidatus Angelobacter sp.]|nr:hypothetical protein [Candidatus Angelobacter sp.]
MYVVKLRGMYSRAMSRSRAVRSGLSAAFRRPAVFAAEVAWRWAFGAAALLLISYSVLLFMSSIPVSDRDLFGLSGVIPGMLPSALAHIFNGSGPKILRLLAALIAGLGLLWWLASAFGRAVVLQELVSQRKQGATGIRILLQINFLRAIFALFALIALAGAFALASRVALAGEAVDSAQSAGPDASVFYLVFLPLAFLVGWVWSTLNWYLTLAPVVALKTGVGVADAIFETAALVLRQARQYFWVGLVFGVLRLLMAGIFLFFAMSAFAVLAQLATGLAFAGLALVALCYFAVADFLGLARLAAYERILVWDSEKRGPEPATPSPQFTNFVTPDPEPI